MSEGLRISRGTATTWASIVVDEIRQYCSRIEIAGSLRRRKPDVGDIEIVCIKKLDANLWGEFQPIPTSAIISKLAGRYPILIGGEKYVQIDTGVCKCDIFITTEEQWGVMFAIRTGPALFSRMLVTRKSFGGHLPNSMVVKDGRLWEEGKLIPTSEEKDFFQAIGMCYVTPEARL